MTPSFSGSYIATWTREGGWGTLVGSGDVANANLSSGGVIMGSGIYPASNPAYIWPGTWNGVTDSWTPIPADAGYAPCGSSRLSRCRAGRRSRKLTRLPRASRNHLATSSE